MSRVFEDFEISFYGQIYNFNELNKEEQIDCPCEEELILYLYKKYSYKFLEKLDAIFSFAIFDKKEQLYFCARDRFGHIPLFYYQKGTTFIYANKISDILKKLNFTPKMNKVALSKYMQYFASFGEDSFYQDVFKLQEATYLIFDIKKEEISKKRYYKINTYKAVKDENIALNKIEEYLFKAIELCSYNNSNFLLSGGLDSSLISAMYTKGFNKQINSFSIGFDEHKHYSELEFAKIVSKHLNTNHTEISINQKEYIENFYSSLDLFDEPHADSASIPLNILFNKLEKNKVQNIYSGEGSDELFLGYENYRKFYSYYNFEKSLTNYQRDFLNDIIIALQNNTKESEYLRRVVKEQNLYNSFGEIFNEIQKRRLFKKLPTFKMEQAKKDPIDWMSYIDLKIWLGNALLSKVFTISHSKQILVHTPFLSKDVVNCAFSIDSNLKLGNTNKYLIKQIANKYLPKEIINRPKKGFSSPFNEWLQKEFKDEILQTILNVNKDTNFFNEEYIKNIYNLGVTNKFKQHLYSLFIFSLWYKRVYL